MKSKHLYYIGGLILLSGVIIVSLMSNIKEEGGGFNRKLVNPSMLTKLKSFTLPKPLNDFIGASGNEYFFTTQKPGEILKTDTNFSSTKYIEFSIPSSFEVTSLLWVKMNFPKVYFFSGNAASIYIGDLRSNKLVDSVKLDYNYDRGTFLSDNIFVYRGFDSSLSEKYLKKIDLTNNKLTVENRLIDKLGDGGLATDGNIAYNKDNNSIIFIQMFSNKFICTDINLDLLYSAKTIDTFNNYSISIAKTISPSGSKSFSPSTPVAPVNLRFDEANGKIYNASLIKANNESQKDYMTNSVIDVYSARDGKYESSFYIPNWDEQKMKRFRVINNKLFVLYKDILQEYELPA